MVNRLLLVDGDPRALRVLDVSLRAAGFDVETTTTGPEAWARLESTRPDLVIADADLAGLDGFDLCARLRQSSVGATVPVILLVAHDTVDRKIRALKAGADDTLPKPVYTKELVARVRACLRRRERDRLAAVAGGRDGGATSDPYIGKLEDVPVVDLIQMLEGNGRSGIAHLQIDGGTPAALYFRGGQVIDAEAGRLSGIDALWRMLTWTAGAFQIEWKSVRRSDVIRRPTAQLVIEGMARLDEWNRLNAALGDGRAVFEVDYRMLGERLAEIPDEVNGILRLCDGVRILRQVIEDSGMPDIDTITALIRLRDEKLIYNIANRVPIDRGPNRERLQRWLTTEPAPIASAIAADSAGTGAGRAAPAGLAPATGSSSVANGPRAAAGHRRHTAPGLGLAGFVEPHQAAGPPEIPDVPAAIRDRALRGPGEHDGISGASIPPDASLALPSPESPLDFAPLSSDHPANPAADDMSRTQRGIGIVAMMPADSEPIASLAAPAGSDEEAPVESPSDPGPEAERADVAPSIRQNQPSRDGVPAFMATAPAASGAVSNPPDATTRVRFSDHDISPRDARDELGLPSRWRFVRFVVATLVLCGLGAAGARHFTGTSSVGNEDHANRQPPVPAPTAVAERERERDLGAPPAGPAAAAESPGAGDGTDRPAAKEPPIPAPRAQLPSQTSPSTEGPTPVGGPAFTRQLRDCRSAFSRNRMRDALESCGAAVATNPRSAEALTMLAHTELNRGRMARAGELAARAIAIDPNLAHAYLIVGGVRQDSGQKAEAKAAYRRYLQLAPRGRYADELRSIVNSL